MAIGTDAACNNQAIHIDLFKGFDAFFHQGIDHGMLETGGNIGANLRITSRAIA